MGKSTLLLQCYEYLLKQRDIPTTDILYFTCDDIRAIGDISIRDIVESYLKNIHNTTPALLEKPVFLLIDEAHYDKQWDLSGKILFDKSPNIFMIFSGSSTLHLVFNADAAGRLKVHDIMPLNYSQHLKLKYNYETDLSNKLTNLLFNKEFKEAQTEEHKVQKDLINLNNYDLLDWDSYFKYGGFSSTLHYNYINDVISELWEIVSKIITDDIAPEFNLNNKSLEQIYRTLVLIASQKPDEISQNKVARSFSKSTSEINRVFRILEQSKLLFHIQSYGSAGKRSKKSWKYYIRTPSLKNAINRKFGHTITSQQEYDGILLENMVASSLFNLQRNLIYNPDLTFDLYYDSRSGVDFVFKPEFKKPVPIEVGLGKKKDKQVRKFMNKYDCDYGIIISNTTSRIEFSDDIVYIPPKTFSYL